MSDQSSHNLAPEKSGAKTFHRKDLWLASILIAFGAFMYYEATKFPSAPMVLGDTLNADVFPRILPKIGSQEFHNISDEILVTIWKITTKQLNKHTNK